LFGDIFSLRDARTLVDRGVTGFLHMIRDTEAIDPAFIARLRDLRVVFVPMLAEERDPAQFVIAKHNTKRLAYGGVPIAVGSSGDTQREMDLLVEAGLSPADVLVAATRNGAAALHEIDQGAIEAGKRADLMVLSANPVEDIRNLRTIDRVMRDGQWIVR
jgi:imidazolonepropionase-like amidohydrolase